ncbi:MAG: electron transfer flavoprotein-ubiquinone oxidoreductase [Robiginitomaculum sp.]
MSQRESMKYDVVIVGGGVAGLSAAIRLKQQAEEKGCEINVALLEKGSEIGAHILSGAVVDPIALNELFPDWKQRGAPLKTAVSKDRFFKLTGTKAKLIPNFIMPPLMRNHGNYIVSLGNVCRWLAEQAENIGVEIYPGFPASEVVYNEDGSVKGVATGDMGVDHNGKAKEGAYTQGIELHGKYTLFCEGARGSLTKTLLKKYNLEEGSCPQKFGIGIKELWTIDPKNHQPGLVQHTTGWPLDNKTGGGSFLYHMLDGDTPYVAVGFVVHLNYKNPYLSPYQEFQRFKMHPFIKGVFEGAKRVSYGARALTEGGFQSVPKLSFPGGALAGCCAGFMNVPRIKGSHNAMKTGMMAAEAAFCALQNGRANDELSEYQTAYENSFVYKDLKKVRNVKSLLGKYGLTMGTVLGGFDMWVNTLLGGFSFFGTMKHAKNDAQSLDEASKHTPIQYPKPDGVISFERLTNVSFSATNHEEDQPCHLHLADPTIPIRINLPKWAEPAQRYCPAGVYEILEEAGEKKFQINAQNCVHCKTCDITDPSENITWVCPEGGGGPNYPNM